MNRTQEKNQGRELQVKKGNSFHPKNSEDPKEKQESFQDLQPQWKMGAPSKKRYTGNDETDLYYDQYGYDGYFGMDPAAMGMLTYPYDYMAWGYGMYPYPPRYYNRGPKSSFKKRNDFGYEQSSKHAKPKIVFVPIASKTREDEIGNTTPNEETKTNSTQFSDEADRPSTPLVKAAEYKDLENARFFVIKSYSEEDVHKSIRNNLWCSTNAGNQKLNDAFIAANGEYPIILLFSINGSGHFVGICQMKSPVDFDRNFDGWSQNQKWKGSFEISWIYIKDVPNQELRHLKNEMNEGKPVPNSRDTQEVPNEIGLMVLDIFEKYQIQTSILDYIEFYESEVKADK